MAKRINIEFETLVTGTTNYLRTCMCCTKKDPRKVQVSSICSGRMRVPYRGESGMCHTEMLTLIAVLPQDSSAVLSAFSFAF